MLMRALLLFLFPPSRRYGLFFTRRRGAARIIAACVTALIFPAAASPPLTQQIAALFAQALDFPPAAHPALQVTLLTPPAQRATLCATPALSLAGALGHPDGMHSVIAQCGRQRRFLQVSLQVTATWWQAARAIAPGEVVTAAQIRAHRGALAHAPGGLIFDPRRIVGHVALRALRPGDALVESQLRPPRAIRAGQRVEMIYLGDGFCIRAVGKALENAALRQRLRIQTAAGQLVTATATAPGVAQVSAE